MTPERAWLKFEVHCDGCDECLWFSLQFCLVGQALQTEYSLACAAYGKPIATVVRQPVRA